MGSSRCALVSGAGDPAGSRLTMSNGLSRSPVPDPTRSGCRTPLGARPRRNGASTLTFIKAIRLAYPKRIRIHWIQDGLSSHWTPAIRAYAAANNIELVPTPTYASYLNRIESTFGAIDEFVCKNADYLDWDAFGHALADHVRHRNTPGERE